MDPDDPELPVTYLDKVMTANGVTNVALAEVCGVSYQAVRQWRFGVYRPGVPYAKLIAAYFGIGRHLLRPDIWDPPPQAPARDPPKRRYERRPRVAA